MEAAAQGRKIWEESRRLRMDHMEESGTTNMVVFNVTAVDLPVVVGWDVKGC